MKRLIKVALSAILGLSLCACSATSKAPSESQAPATSETLSESQAPATSETVNESPSSTENSTATAKSTYIIGLDDNFPPMGYKDEKGELVGFDIDLAKEVASRMGVEFKFQPIDWKSKELELKSKKVDLLWNGLTITDARKAEMLFTSPYLKNKQVIMVKDGSGIVTKADLAGKIIGVQSGSSAVDAIAADKETSATFKSVVSFDNNIMAFTDLDIARIDAVVVDEIVAKYYLAQNKPNLVLLEENFGEEDYGIASRLDETQLIDNIQKVLNEMVKDGKAEEISTKWFGSNIVVDNN